MLLIWLGSLFVHRKAFVISATPLRTLSLTSWRRFADDSGYHLTDLGHFLFSFHVRAGVPTMPDATNGFCVSKGMVFLFTVI